MRLWLNGNHEREVRGRNSIASIRQANVKLDTVREDVGNEDHSSCWRTIGCDAEAGAIAPVDPRNNI